MEAAASRYSATGELNNHQKITSRCLAHEYSFTYIFNDINHGYKAALLKKNYLWLLSIYMNGLLIAIMKRSAERMRTP